jgi:putative tributyrin esterase
MKKLRKMVAMARKPFHALRLLYVCLAGMVPIVLLAGCHSKQLPALPDTPRRAPGVAMQDVSFYSAALKRQVTYRVYLPAKIAPGQKLPVVYLLHGNGGSFQNWSNYSDVAKYAAPENSGGVILVMVEGGRSYYVNSASTPDDKYEDYLITDLIGDVQNRFPAATDRSSRAVVGVSMGGFAAVKLALTHPDLFAFAAGISPAVDVPSRRFTLRRWAQSMRFRHIFGPAGSATRHAADPFLLARSANPSATPYIYITAGEQEPLLEPNRRFAALLKQRGFSYEFHTKPGGHDWTEWDAQIPGCFDSLLRHLKRPG